MFGLTHEMIAFAPVWKEFLLTPVLGYIDPNTGGMIFQILAIAFAALSGFFLIFSSRIKSAFYKLRRRMKNENSELDENQAINHDQEQDTVEERDA